MPLFYPTITDHIKNFPIYLTSIGIDFEETMITRDFGYNDYQWIQTISGKGELFVHGERQVLTPNTGILIPANIAHSYKRLTNQWLTHWFTFNGQSIPTLFEQLELGDISIIQPKDSSQLRQDIEELYYLATSNSTSHELTISSKVYQALDTIHRSYLYQNQSNSSSKASLIQPALDYIHKNYMTELTIDQIADTLHISPQYLCRLFKEQLGVRPFEYIQQVRINQAKSLLLEMPTPKIEDIVFAVGFQTPSYFTSIFKKREKITPRDFIKLHQRGV